MNESILLFKSSNKQLMGIHHHKEESFLQNKNKAVVIVVGGPQTRVGSHRHFVTLARSLAKQGIDVFRFDYTGGGDSEGEPAHFEQVKFDVDAAVSQFKKVLSYNVEITLWGLCDAASAILLYIKEFNNNIHHLVLLNPWVYKKETAAKVRINSYYWQRLKQASFWKKLLLGRIKPLNTIIDIKKLANEMKCTSMPEVDFVTAMLEGLTLFTGNVDIILSENDLVAQEFLMLIQSNNQWKKVIQKSYITLQIIPQANHTFAKEQWKDQVENITYQGIIK